MIPRSDIEQLEMTSPLGIKMIAKDKDLEALQTVTLNKNRLKIRFDPKLSYERSHWKKFFKNQSDYLKAAGWDSSQQSFKNVVVYEAIHGGRDFLFLLVSDRFRIFYVFYASGPVESIFVQHLFSRHVRCHSLLLLQSQSPKMGLHFSRKLPMLFLGNRYLGPASRCLYSFRPDFIFECFRLRIIFFEIILESGLGGKILSNIFRRFSSFSSPS